MPSHPPQFPAFRPTPLGTLVPWDGHQGRRRFYSDFPPSQWDAQVGQSSSVPASHSLGEWDCGTGLEFSILMVRARSRPNWKRLVNHSENGIGHDRTSTER